MRRDIAKYIALAQIASDGGKYARDVNKAFWWDDELPERKVKNEITHLLPVGEVYFKKGYKSKDTYIAKAINEINRTKNSGFYYHVKADGERARIIYFNFKINNKRYQVSFHSFSARFDTYLGKNCATRWDHKSSRFAAAKLATISKDKK